MTLIIGMSKADGIYLSADYRVTRGGRLVTDEATKFLTLYWPPDPGGLRVLMAYTGVAILGDGTPTGTWIRETLRGEMDETFDQSMAHLRERLDRDVGPMRSPLIINLLGIVGERRYIGALSNVPRNTPHIGRPTFEYMLNELDRPLWFANGYGAQALMRYTKMQVLMNKQIGIRPHNSMDHMNLLAVVNRKVALRDKRKTVSPFCHVSFLGEQGEPKARAFTERGESVPYKVPTILFGVDISVIAEPFQEHARAWFEHGIEMPAIDADEVNRQLRRRP